MAERTDDEIVARVLSLAEEDPLGFERLDLICFLPWDRAKEFFKGEADPQHKVDPRDRESVLKTMREYLDFAVGKAVDHRGLSAGRSICHYQAWIWMLGEEDYNAINWENYPRYGAPILKQISDRFGFTLPERRYGFDRMAEGDACEDGCGQGCNLGY